MTSKARFTYPKNIRFTCSKCGLCCRDTPNKTRHVLLLKKDAERIAAHTKRPVNSFAMETSRNAPYLFEMCKNADSGICIFLKENQCTIYLQRPLICKFYPFELTTDESGKFVFKETEECPAIGGSESKGTKKLDARFFSELLNLACSQLNGL